MNHASFATTTRGLNRALPPMRLFERAKKLGVWNPSEIDLSKDKFSKRAERLEKARGASLDEINCVTQSVIESGDA